MAVVIRYGRKDCEHIWAIRSDGWEESCVPLVCVECGAFACMCAIVFGCLDDAGNIDVEKMRRVYDEVWLRKELGNANTNGKWENPYVVQKEQSYPFSV